jgi:hypothetical protein
MIRQRQSQTEKAAERTEPPLDLTQRQADHCPYRPCDPYRESRIVGLTAVWGAGLGPPGGTGLLGEP